jgi:hypothetical protein
MIEFPKVMSKGMWFLLFNVGTILYLIVSGTLHRNVINLVSFGLALALINGIAWISARKFKWKYGLPLRRRIVTT